MSFSKISVLAGTVAFATRAAAHGLVLGIVADGVYYDGYNTNYKYMATQPEVAGWSIPEDESRGFIAPSAYTDPDIICHLDATNGQAYATVAAGGVVELQWTEWPESHHGPMIDYLASCNGDCTTVDKTTLEFFKIDEVGLIDGSAAPGTWGSDQMIANNNTWAVTIPSDIAPGKYVLRHETIALHSANNADGAQNYPQCVNLEITGSGTATPSGVLATEFYTPADLGILVNIYQALSTYVIPGPTLYSGAVDTPQTGATSATSAATSATSAADGEATSAPVITSVEAPVTTSAPASVVEIASTGFPVYSNSTATGTGRPGRPTRTPKGPSKTRTRPVATSTATSVTVVESTVIVSPIPAATGVATASSFVQIPSQTATPTLENPESEASQTTSPSALEPPTGTTLNNLLSWLSSFYTSHADKEYTGSTVVRRHARDISV
ncbi:glycosyl hydrolase family 61-domain-containing protein [Bisporella sp. PMI_857]|nr:glycosyl hydrolase family 61-domain-containing protein [Bisporella sp. PMI_857]